MKLPIFLDHHSTTPLDPEVLEAMMPYLTEHHGNAASRQHAFGWKAEEAVDEARREVSELIGARPEEIIFTSGATESDNLALKGVAGRQRSRGDHIVTSAVEHSAVLETCRRLEREGYRVTYLPVDGLGRLDPGRLEKAITDRTVLVSLMAAQNEIGNIYPLGELAAVARDRGVLFHTDAAQALGRLELDVRSLGIDLLSVSAHKVHGPKGVGALYVRRKGGVVALNPLIDGGGHESGLRSGTLNVAGIVGFGAACRIYRETARAEAERVLGLRERLHSGLTARLEGVHLNGDPVDRLPGNLHLSFDGVEAEALMVAIRDVAVSSGSACTSARPQPSHVLRALGIPPDRAHSSIRIGIGRGNTEEEIDYVVEAIGAAVGRLRRIGTG